MKPPDVICIELPEKENPLIKWINLENWAISNNDGYLKDRAHQMILNLLHKQQTK